MFKRLRKGAATVSLTVDGERFAGHPGETVAGLMMAEGLVPVRRNPASGAPRHPYCMLGTCHDCLVAVELPDGRRLGRVRGCAVEIREGMKVTRC